MNIIVKPYGNDLCYCRPDTTWERENRDFYSPECVNEIFWAPVVFARVSKAGKCIGRKFVERYYDGVGCGMLMYCHANPPVTSVDPRLRFAQTPPSRGWHVDSGHPADSLGSISACVDHTSILPMPIYNPAVLESPKEFVVTSGTSVKSNGCSNCDVSSGIPTSGSHHATPGGHSVIPSKHPVIPSEHPVILSEAKNLLEETICSASELTSLRIGDFVAVELEAMKGLASRENGDVEVKGTFCENGIFDFKVIF